MNLKIVATSKSTGVIPVADLTKTLSLAGFTITEFELKPDAIDPLLSTVCDSPGSPETGQRSRSNRVPRPWEADPRCVLQEGTRKIDVEATLRNMGFTLAYLDQQSYSHGTLECAVKISNGQSTKKKLADPLSRTGLDQMLGAKPPGNGARSTAPAN